MVLERGQKMTLIGVGVLFFITFLVSQYIKKDINDNAAYTICKTTSYYSGSNGSFIRFYYFINNKKYTNSDYYDDKYQPKVGSYYRVKYSSENPSLSEIIQSERITDSATIVNAGLKLPTHKPRRNQFRD